MAKKKTKDSEPAPTTVIGMKRIRKKYTLGDDYQAWKAHCDELKTQSAFHSREATRFRNDYKKSYENGAAGFCTYLPEYFFREWSSAQLEIAKNVEKIIENGGSQAIAHKRRGAKTTICLGGLFWAALYGKHMYSFFIAAEGGAALGAKEFFETELMQNDLLLADFPDICMPIRVTEGIKQRHPTYHGDQCNIGMTGNQILFPTMRVYDKSGNRVKKDGKPVHYAASGALIKFISVASSGVRGRQHVLADRGNSRPSLALIDDPQNDGMARSEEQIKQLDNFVRKTIAPMSGYDKETKKIKSPAIMMTVTCIQPNDFAVRYTDRKLTPDYNGLLFRRFEKMPAKIPQLWSHYKELWIADGGSRSKPCFEREATKFYIANRKAMDRDFLADDENDYEEYQVSAIQYGMDMWCENESSFWCEHQNDPEAALAVGGMGLTPKFILEEKTKRFKDSDTKNRLSFRRWIPENTAFLAGFIDVGLHYLNYEITAFGKGYSFAHVVDFGYFPDQKGWHNIRKKRFNVDIQKTYRNGSPEEKISWAVRDCLSQIYSTAYFDHTGQPFDIHAQIPLTFGRDAQQARFLAMVGVDARDHDQEEAVWSGVAQFNELSKDDFPVMHRAMPCYGEPTASRHLRSYDLQNGEWQRGRERFYAGEGDWIEYPISKRPLTEKYHGRVHSCMMWEANTYRTMRDTGWNTEKGAEGCQTLFDDIQEILKPYADQQCSMVSEMKVTRHDTSDYKLWVLRKPANYDKEFFDTNSGCWAIASYLGLNPEYGYKIEPEFIELAKGMNWLEKLKEKNAGKMPEMRGRTARS